MRAICDHKRERLRAAYEMIYLAARRVQRTPVPTLTTLDRAEKERLFDRLADLREAISGLEKVQVRLLLDDAPADHILKLFRELIELWRRSGDLLGGHKNATDPVSAEHVAQAMERLEEQVIALRDAARAHLAALEKPI